MRALQWIKATSIVAARPVAPYLQQFLDQGRRLARTSVGSQGYAQLSLEAFIRGCALVICQVSNVGV
jgi:hypothetical protein